MTKLLATLLLVSALLVGAMGARDPSGATGVGRSLLQSYTCTQVQSQLKGNCGVLFDCLNAKVPAIRNMKDLVMGMCEGCVTASRVCPASNALPSQCSSGLRQSAAMQCIAQYLSNNKASTTTSTSTRSSLYSSYYGH